MTVTSSLMVFSLMGYDCVGVLLGQAKRVKNRDFSCWVLEGALIMREGGVILVVLSFWLDPKGPKDQDFSRWA